MSASMERPDRSFAVCVLGYIAFFAGWHWWALRSEDPMSAAVLVVPPFLLEFPVLLASGVAIWLMAPPRRLRGWLCGVFLLLIGIEISVFGHADVDGLVSTINGRPTGLLGYGSRVCLLTMAFFAASWMGARDGYPS